MANICGDIQGIEYTRYPDITTIMLEEYIRKKIAVILDEQGITTPHEVYCFPIVLGDTRGGIKYATMMICMSGIDETDESLYSKIKQFSYRPKINKGIQNAIVKAYEFSNEKLVDLMEHPKKLRNLALSPRDIDFIHSNRKLQVHSIQGKPYYSFAADMDRILDEFLMDGDTDDIVIPNYIVIGIKSLGDNPDSPLSYDVLTTADATTEMDNAAAVFKSLISK